jgi:hypothetical protein
MCNDYPWDPKIVEVVDWWSLFRGHLSNIISYDILDRFIRKSTTTTMTPNKAQPMIAATTLPQNLHLRHRKLRQHRRDNQQQKQQQRDNHQQFYYKTHNTSLTNNNNTTKK